MSWKIGRIVTLFGTHEGAIVDEKGHGVAAFFGEDAKNARDLCLTAPRMLEELKGLLAVVEPDLEQGRIPGKERIARVRALIAEAEGK